FSTCATSCTPASRIALPPIPVSVNGAPTSPSARATPAPGRSPEASPATNRISRTRNGRRASGERGERSLDVGDDLQRHGERLPTGLSRHRNRNLAAHRGKKALELKTERLPLLRTERDPLDELLERDRRGRQRRHVDVAP